MERDLYEVDHEMFREVAVELNSRDVAPHHQQWGHLLPTVAGNCKFNAATSTVGLTLDPTATTTVSQSASVLYRCTKGTAPAFDAPATMSSTSVRRRRSDSSSAGTTWVRRSWCSWMRCSSIRRNA